MDKSTLTFVPGDLPLSNPFNFYPQSMVHSFPPPVQALFLTLPSAPQLALLAFRFSLVTKNMHGTSFRPVSPIDCCLLIRPIAKLVSKVIVPLLASTQIALFSR